MADILSIFFEFIFNVSERYSKGLKDMYFIIIVSLMLITLVALAYNYQIETMQTTVPTLFR
jgi:hypothetical protein